METKKTHCMFFLLFFLGGFIFASGGTEESGKDSAVQSNTTNFSNERVSLDTTPIEDDTPFRLSEKDDEAFFLRRLMWEQAIYAVRYTIILEQKRGNLDAYVEVYRRNTERTYVDITFPPGEYRFHVISYNVLGLVDAQSEWDYFTVRNHITLLQPESGSAMSINPLSPSSVVWSKELVLENTRVLFSREPDPAKDPRAIVQYSAQGATTLNLPPLGEGIWYWTVFGETADGLSVSAALPMWFTVVSLPLLSSPQYVQPGGDAVITLNQLMQERKISFKWEKVSEANAYIFSLYGNSDKVDLLFSSSPIPETSFDFTELAVLNMDNYFWQVEAVLVSRNGTIERRGIIEQQAFEVLIQRSDNLRTRNMGTIYGFE